MSGVAAFWSAATAIVTALITISFEGTKLAAAQKAQRETAAKLEDMSAKSATCETQRQFGSSEQVRLTGESETLSQERDKLVRRLAAATAVGQGRELPDRSELDAVLGLWDWIEIPLVGSTAILELTRVGGDGVVFRLGGCQSPRSPDALMQVAGVPAFKLDRTRTQQTLQLSSSCCSSRYAACDQTTLQNFSITLTEFDKDYYRAHILAKSDR